jgi:hypothetical protein
VYRVTTDLTPYFIEKGISLLTRGGILSLLVSDAWLRAGYGKPLRKYLMNRQIVEIIDFGGGMHDLTGACILRVSNTSPSYPFRASKVQNPGGTDLDQFVRLHGHPVDQAMLNDGGWTLEDTRTAYIIGKLRSAGKPLGEYVMGQLTRGAGSRFPTAVVIDEQTKKRLVGEESGQSPLLKPFLRGKDIHRYARPRPDHYLIQMPEGWIRSHADEISDPGKWLLERYLKISRHPAQFKSAGGSGSDNQDLWCEQRIHDRSLSPVQARIISPTHAQRPSFTMDAGVSLTDEQVTIISYPDLYLLGILNSKVTDFFIRLTNPKNNDRHYVYSPRSLSRIPVYTPDFDNPVDRGRHDRIELLVAHRLDLQEQLIEMTEEHEHSLVQKEIERTEGAIDEAVYTIYGLTREERIIIDKETAGYRG